MKKIIVLLLFFAAHLAIAQVGDFPYKILTDSDLKLTSWQKEGELYSNQTMGNNEFSINKEVKAFKLKFDYLSQNGTLNLHLKNGIYLKFDDHLTLVVNDIGQKSTKPVLKAPKLWNTVELIGGAERLEFIKVNGITVFQNVFIPSESHYSIHFGTANGSTSLRSIGFMEYSTRRPVEIEKFSFTLQETNDWDKQFSLTDKAPIVGEMKLINHNIPHSFNRYKLHFKGAMNVDHDGLYAFTIDYQGLAKLLINGKEVVGSTEENFRNALSGQVELKKGSHELEYIYQNLWWRPALGLFVSGPDFRPYPFHADRALPAAKKPDGIYISEVQNKAKLVRGFYQYKNTKKTETIHVGTSQQRHFTFDLATGSLLSAWKGDFGDVTEMWFERGQPQLFTPLGLGTGWLPEEAFRDDYMDGVQTHKYTLDPKGIPVFELSLGDNKIQRSFETTEKGISSKIVCENVSNVHHVLAEGDMEKLDSRTYLFPNYMLQFPIPTELNELEGIDGTKQYMITLPKGKSILTYQMIW